MSSERSTLRWIVAITPLAGAMAFPVVVPLTIARVGIGAGVGVALVLSTRGECFLTDLEEPGWCLASP